MLGKIFEYALTAGTPVTLPGGSYLRVMTANSDLTLTFFDESGTPLGEWAGVLGGFAIDAHAFAEKLGLTTARFGRVQVESAVNQTVEIAVSRVPIRFDRLTGTITTTSSAGATATQSSATAGAASGLLLAANANRKRAWLRNTSATDRVHFCDDGTVATAAHPYIEPGEEIEYSSQDGLNAIRGGGTDIAVLIREERD